jgi:hypothetical protein
MNVKQVEAKLVAKYPHAKIVHNTRVNFPQKDVFEVIAEIEPGYAVVAIERSQSHFHLHTVENYKILEGQLALVVSGRVILLDTVKYKPATPRRSRTTAQVRINEVHHAVSLGPEPAIVEVRSNPPWQKGDHHEV